MSDDEYSVKPVKWEPGLFLDKSKYESWDHTMHWHNELELGVVERGSGRTMVGHSWMATKPGELSLFWGIVPHGLTKATSGVPVAYTLHIPMALFMEWGLPEILVDRILTQTRLLDISRGRPCSDLALMQYWHALLQEGEASATEIVVHEVQARLRCMARNLHLLHPPDQEVPPEGDDRTAHLAGQMIKLIGARHREPITPKDIADAVGLSSSYASHVFRKVCGMTIGDYIQRSRVATAQHLLVTTNDKITAVGHDSGFCSMPRFFVVFKQISGQTPNQYRNSVRP